MIGTKSAMSVMSGRYDSLTLIPNSNIDGILSFIGSSTVERWLPFFKFNIFVLKFYFSITLRFLMSFIWITLIDCDTGIGL